jgi:hypothetical protein
LQAAGALAQLDPAQVVQVTAQPVSVFISVMSHFIVQPGPLPLHWATHPVCVVWAPAAQSVAAPVQSERAGQPPSAFPVPLLDVVLVVAPAPSVA